MSSMTECIVRRIEDLPLQPWKNGGGFARELASGDGWRISLACVEREGTCSVYDGVTRHSIVVSGTGLRLRDGGDTMELSSFEPVRYDGGRAWQATLMEGPAQVLNVMVDARRWGVRLRAGAALDNPEAFTALLVLPLGSGCRCSMPSAPSATTTATTSVAPGEYLFRSCPEPLCGLSVRPDTAGESSARTIVAALGPP